MHGRLNMCFSNIFEDVSSCCVRKSHFITAVKQHTLVFITKFCLYNNNHREGLICDDAFYTVLLAYLIRGVLRLLRERYYHSIIIK